jgi:hypothetical protein
MGPMNLICASKLHLIFFSTCLVLFSVFSPSNLFASDVDSNIAQTYSRSDYATAEKLLEEGIKRSEEKPPGDVKTAAQELYSNYLSLAYIHAWKLGDLDKGLMVYKMVLLDNNEDPTLQSYAASAIGMIGDPSALGALKKVMESGKVGDNMSYKIPTRQFIEALSRKGGS